MQGCADPSFGLQPQALAIAHLLAGRAPDFADWDEKARRFDIETETHPWYNGKERCIWLRVYRGPGPCQVLHVVFGEDRRSDRLFVEHWEENWKVPRLPTSTTLEGVNTEAYEEASQDRELFEAHAVGRVADRIFEIMAEFYAKL